MTKLAGNTLVLTANNTYTGPTTIVAGTLRLGSGATSGSIAGNVADGGTLVFNRSDDVSFGGVVSGSGGLAKLGPNTLTLTGSNTYGGLTSVSAGTLALQKTFVSGSSFLILDGAVARIASSVTTPNNVVLRTASLNTSTTGQLDVNDNKLIITAGTVGTASGGVYTGLTGLVQTGRNGGAWDGGGIVTSQSQALGGNYTSLGIAQASDVRSSTVSQTTLWAGQTITGTDVLVMYTYGGDATLDGKINIDDYVKIDSGIAAGLTGWSNGDFNYDGKINIDDYATFIDANIGNQTGTFPTGGGAGVSAVPEPAGVGAAMLALGAFSMRRRRAASKALSVGWQATL